MASSTQAKKGHAATILKFSDNVQATISVELVDGDGEYPANIYGNITCRYNLEKDFTVFDRNQYDSVDVKPWQYIPLDSPRVDVPTTATTFEIKVYLMDYDVISYDDEIANGTAKFPVKSAGESQTITVTGKYGKVYVKVVWG